MKKAPIITSVAGNARRPQASSFIVVMMTKITIILCCFCLIIEAHERRFCQDENLPVVVLERVHHSNSNDGGSSSKNNSNVLNSDDSPSFRVIQRYDPSEIDTAYDEWVNADTRRHTRRLLQAKDYSYDDIKSSSEEAELLQLRRRNLLMSSSSLSVEAMAVPGLRILHSEHSNATTLLASGLTINNSNSSSNNNGDDDDDHRREYFLARECSCFVQENYQYVLCPFATDHCGQVVDDHGERSETENGYYPETLMCYSEQVQRTNSNTYKIIWLLTVIAWANFAFAILMTPKGRSCLSFIPARLPWLKDRWNPAAADYLLLHRRDQANAMIRTHVHVLRRQLHLDFERQLRRQERERRRAEARGGVTRTTSDGIHDRGSRRTAAMIELVAGIGGFGTGTGQNDGRQRPTSLVLSTKIYKKSPPEETEMDSTKVCEVNDANDDHDDDDDDRVHECAICYTGFEDGDRVGSLPCDHIFHVECLKMWLKRQNICPFCRKDHVAVERFNETENENHDGDDDKDQDDINNDSNIAENDAAAVSEQTGSIVGSDNNVSAASNNTGS
jgi:Ring finger domain